MYRSLGRALIAACVLCALLPHAARAAQSYAERVHEKILPNGLKILLLEDHKAPVGVFQVWYRVGSRNEQLGKTGLSHMLEHLMFKGTHKVGPGRVLEDHSAQRRQRQRVYLGRRARPTSRRWPAIACRS